MSASKTNEHSSPQTAPATNTPHGDRPSSMAELINEAEMLRGVLLDASTRVARLLGALKQHRRQSRAMQAAVQSLKQLQLES